MLAWLATPFSRHRFERLLPTERIELIFSIGSPRKHHAVSGEVACFVVNGREWNRRSPDRVGSAR
jgi:hypothetical protein